MREKNGEMKERDRKTDGERLREKDGAQGLRDRLGRDMERYMAVSDGETDGGEGWKDRLWKEMERRMKHNVKRNGETVGGERWRDR